MAHEVQQKYKATLRDAEAFIRFLQQTYPGETLHIIPDGDFKMLLAKLNHPVPGDDYSFSATEVVIEPD